MYNRRDTAKIAGESSVGMFHAYYKIRQKVIIL